MVGVYYHNLCSYSLHQHEYLMQNLFPEKHRPKESESSKESETSVQGIVHQHTELASELAYNASELFKTKSKLLAVRNDRTASLYRCRELMGTLEDLKFEVDDPVETGGQELEESSLNTYSMVFSMSVL